jgi:hypothetical protein
MSKQTFVKTRPCPVQLSEGSCTNTNCTYAHSLEELKHTECNFGNKCTKKDTNCTFKHPDESVENFRKRINFVEPKFFDKITDSPSEIRTSTCLPPFVLDRNDSMSHVVASMALLMKRDVKWV